MLNVQLGLISHDSGSADIDMMMSSLFLLVEVQIAQQIMRAHMQVYLENDDNIFFPFNGYWHLSKYLCSSCYNVGMESEVGKKTIEGKQARIGFFCRVHRFTIPGCIDFYLWWWYGVFLVCWMK